VCNELLRILAPGGSFFGSFNLGEPATFNELLTLTEPMLHHALLRHLRVESYRTARGGTRWRRLQIFPRSGRYTPRERGISLGLGHKTVLSAPVPLTYSALFQRIRRYVASQRRGNLRAAWG
jgi:hypothetical protein